MTSASDRIGLGFLNIAAGIVAVLAGFDMIGTFVIGIGFLMIIVTAKNVI